MVMIIVVESLVVVKIAGHDHEARLRPVHGQPSLAGWAVQTVVVPDVVLGRRSLKVEPGVNIIKKLFSIVTDDEA